MGSIGLTKEEIRVNFFYFSHVSFYFRWRFEKSVLSLKTDHNVSVLRDESPLRWCCGLRNK